MKALIPIDGSQQTYEAMDRALALLAGTPGLKVTLFNVTHEGFEDAPEHLVDEFEADEDDEIFPTESSSWSALTQAAARPSCKGLNVETKVVKGKVVSCILAECESHDVLVMHRLGKSNWKDRLTLSQTERLVRTAPCSVLLVD